VVVFVVDAKKWTAEDDNVLKLIENLNCPVFLAVNEVDEYKDKSKLLPILEKYAKKMDFQEVFPISALKKVQLEALENKIYNSMPENPHFFAKDDVTDKPEYFHFSEIVREKLMRRLGQEIPYALAVEIEKVEKEQDPEKTIIYAIIWVEKASQKHIVIGKQGEKLKQIGIDARRDLEARIGHQVRLQLWVKVREGWSDDKRALQNLGYIDLNE